MPPNMAVYFLVPEIAANLQNMANETLMQPQNILQKKIERISK